MPYVIRVRVIYYIRNFDFVGVKLKCHGTLCFWYHFYIFTGFFIGGWVRTAGGWDVSRVISYDEDHWLYTGGGLSFLPDACWLRMSRHFLFRIE